MKNRLSFMAALFAASAVFLSCSCSGGEPDSGLELLAERTAASMKAHRLKVLHLMAHDVNSDAAKEAYKAFINANDQLEGIVVIQYSPYNGGHGNIMWFANKEGYDIPVISAGDSFKAVSVQELIWRIRMKERKEQTLKYLKTIK